MLRIYQRMWQVNWAEQWQYRANLLMYLLYWLVSPIVYLAVWTTVANSQGSVQGLTANDFVTYYLTLLIVDNLTSQITIHILAYKIQDGTLSSDLLKPVHPILTTTLMSNLAFKALNFSASPAFHNYGNAQTLHTIITEPPKRRLLIGIGGDAAALEEDMIDVDFKLWVAGEDLPIEHLKGQLGLGLPSSRRPRARPQLKVQPRQ